MSGYVYICNVEMQTSDEQIKHCSSDWYKYKYKYKYLILHRFLKQITLVDSYWSIIIDNIDKSYLQTETIRDTIFVWHT